MDQKLTKMIDAYLAEVITAKEDQELPEAEWPEIHELHDIIEALLKAKYECVYDDYVPVQITVNNLTSHDRMHFNGVRKIAEHHPETNEDLEVWNQALSDLKFNVSSASSDLGRFVDMSKFHLHRFQERKDNE